MSSCKSNDFGGRPSVHNTVGPSWFVRALDFLAGPLALAAAGLTFFMAYELTVAQPADWLVIVEPVPSLAVVAPQPQISRTADVSGPVPAQADAKTISMVAGAAPKEY
jgi:hypothetical protein